MQESQQSLHFSLFQQIVFWLNHTVSEPRQGRCYLEKHRELLEVNIDEALEVLIASLWETFEEEQQMLSCQALIEDIHRRGGTLTAIREAYVNICGGFALDLPPWMEEVEEKQQQLRRIHRPERTARAQIVLLQGALKRAFEDESVAQEIVAELQNVVGALFMQHIHSLSHAALVEALEQGILLHEGSLIVYTEERYPLQHAKTRILLGVAYLHYSTFGKSEYAPICLDRAIQCYEVALRIYHRQCYFPVQWALLQTSLGVALLQNSQGDRALNQERALACHEAGMCIADKLSTPLVKVTILINLGDFYLQRIAGEREENLKRAMSAFRQALSILTRQSHPFLWAKLHHKLAQAFQAEGAIHANNRAKRDLKLNCAIVCCECALNVYTVDAYPFEYATTLVMLGNLHSRRFSDEILYHAEQAVKHYHSALRIFNSQTFPARYRQTLQSLARIEERRQRRMRELRAFTQ